MELPKEYNFREEEKKWQKYWEKEKVYKFNSNSKKKMFSIDTPPPTVSGKMHIGHAFQYSQMDFIARYKRMRGYELFYPFGTDDNGLPTERLIEKLKNVKAQFMNRQEFVNLCNETLKDIRPKFVQGWKDIGMSCDFDLFYSTINEHCRKISQRSFLEIYRQGRIYRKEAPTIWCTECRTAIAQVEMKDKQKTTNFVHIEVKTGDKDKVVFATTRPELYPGCVGMSVNPNDSRYKKLIGKKIIMPITNAKIEITADEMVDPEFGTGVVYFCSSGDAQFLDWELRHKVKNKVFIVDPDGRMNEKAGRYKGLTIQEARKKIVGDLQELGAIKKIEPLEHVINVHERCGTDIEYISSKQWFIRYLDLKDKLLESGNKIKWYPEFMKQRYVNWVKGLKWDWCISRQRFFGVPFPIWYCKKCGETKLADEKNLPVDPLYDKPGGKCKCGSSEFIPEKDILDTWTTSSLTPQLAIELVDKKLKNKLFPMDLRAQAHDIITFWAFNTIVKSYLHENKIPWKDTMISGFVTLEGEKMSKSKGNLVEPQDVLDKYGADSLRFWCASGKLGEDTDYMEKEVQAGLRTMIKLWNAAKFSIMHLQDYEDKPKKLEIMDKWILGKLNGVIKESTEHFDNYDYSKNKMEMENFFWNTFCDNYLEIVKNRLYGNDKGKRTSAQYSLYNALISILKMFAPIMPYITEEIWNLYFKDREKVKSIHISEWPNHNKKLEDKKIEEIGDKFVEILSKVRQFKTSNKLSLKAEISLTLEKDDYKLLKDALDDLKAVTNAKEIKEGKFEIKL